MKCHAAFVSMAMMMWMSMALCTVRLRLWNRELWSLDERRITTLEFWSEIFFSPLCGHFKTRKDASTDIWSKDSALEFLFTSPKLLALITCSRTRRLYPICSTIAFTRRLSTTVIGSTNGCICFYAITGLFFLIPSEQLGSPGTSCGCERSQICHISWHCWWQETALEGGWFSRRKVLRSVVLYSTYP